MDYRRWTVRSWVAIGLALLAVVWIVHLIGPYGPTEVGKWSAVAAWAYLLLALIVGPVLLGLRGLIWFRGSAATRRDELQRRFDARLCTECGYDLRTLPDRCPECGAPRERWWA